MVHILFKIEQNLINISHGILYKMNYNLIFRGTHIMGNGKGLLCVHFYAVWRDLTFYVVFFRAILSE